MKINHDFIIKTILDNNGYIHGGYARSWIANGEPSDNGWKDIDCVFPNISDYEKTQQELFEKLGEEAPVIDIGFPANLPFNDFFCNCWQFDGKMRPKELMGPPIDPNKLKEETTSKIARCIINFETVTLFPWRVERMIKNGWEIIDNNERNIIDVKYKHIAHLLRGPS